MSAERDGEPEGEGQRDRDIERIHGRVAEGRPRERITHDVDIVGEPHERARRLDRAPPVHRHVQGEKHGDGGESGEEQSRWGEERPRRRGLASPLGFRRQAPASQERGERPERGAAERQREPHDHTGFGGGDAQLDPAPRCEPHGNGRSSHAAGLAPPRRRGAGVTGDDLRSSGDRRQVTGRATDLGHSGRSLLYQQPRVVQPSVGGGPRCATQVGEDRGAVQSRHHAVGSERRSPRVARPPDRPQSLCGRDSQEQQRGHGPKRRRLLIASRAGRNRTHHGPAVVIEQRGQGLASRPMCRHFPPQALQRRSRQRWSRGMHERCRRMVDLEPARELGQLVEGSGTDQQRRQIVRGAGPRTRRYDRDITRHRGRLL